jgi:hypothetical protein
MPKTRSSKKYNVFNEAIPYILLSKRERTKNTNFEPLHSLLRKGSKYLDISYGWDTTSFYDDEDKLITSGKLVKYEVDTNSNMTRYNKEVFSFKYIKYKDYIISFNECNINIKSTIDINNLLYIGSPEANDELTESNDELTESNDELTESNDELTESNDKLTESNDELTESNDKEPEHNTDNYVLQHQLHLQGQTPQIYHQFQFQLQQQFYQHSFIQNIVRNEIHTTLLPWIKEYIDFEINKLNS